MTEDELINVVRAAVRAEFSAAGIRVDDAEDQDEAREDFRFLRRLRVRADSVSKNVGMAVIMAVILAALGMLWSGFTNSIK
ncbi:hypothetical protein ACVQH5_29345 [Klebsiella pneumoniae]